ncbi:MAG: hypothetical protein PQJ61_12030 [Spirochaetales bacterium]|uniref:Uncharacterized protein n=1 Tax=Candidatus Thalassospirochaeta sargassi TaxID=3119039 RepID=A0AAJ1IGH0_9SPIO|nr:hypothetical protein [Spirochaetales bacterium]
MKRLFSVLLLISAAYSGYADDFYESNILSMKLKTITNPAEAGTEFMLRISETEDGNELKLLYRGNELFSRTEIIKEGVKILEITEEGDNTTRLERENGIITSELFEKGDGNTELIEYFFTGRRLNEAVISLNGETEYIDSYFYTDEGRLLEVKRNYFVEKNPMVLSFIYNQGLLSRFWMTSDDRKNYIMFDSKGILLNELFGSENWNEKREYIRNPDGSREEVITNNNDGTTLRLSYDMKKRLYKSEFRDGKGLLVEDSEWIYRGEYLYKYTVRQELSLQVYIYDRDREGEIIKETFMKNGIIAQVTEYSDENDYTEILYRGGKAVLEIKYTDGVRTGTVQLQD